MQSTLALAVCLSAVAILHRLAWPVVAVATENLGETAPCTCCYDAASEERRDDMNAECNVDGYVGSSVMYEDEYVRVWNFTLAPGETTSMHRHDHDYHFVVLRPSQLAVYGEGGERLFDFRAEGTIGFTVSGDLLDPIGLELPFDVPRVHAARNIGGDYYHEILFESKKGELLREHLDVARAIVAATDDAARSEI